MASNISKVPKNMLSNPNLDAADTGVDPSTGRYLTKKERIGIFKRRKIRTSSVFGKKSSTLAKVGNIRGPLAKFGAIVKSDKNIIKKGESPEKPSQSPKLEDKPETTKIEPQNKLILTLIKKVEINSEKITSLTNTVKSNIKKISKILVRGPNKDQPQNKLINSLVKQVENNSKKITLLKNIVKLNIEKVSKILIGDAEKKKKEQREDQRQQKIDDEKDKKKKKEGLLERVGKSVGKSLLKPVEAVGKTVKGVLGDLGKAFMALFMGFVINKAIKMIQAHMSGDTETFKEMRNTIIKSIAVVGGIFLILNGGLLALPGIITGVVSGIIAIGGAILAFLVSPAGLIALAVAGGVGAFLGLKKLFNKNKEKKLELEKTKGKPIKNSRGRTIGYDKPKGDGSGDTSGEGGSNKVDPFVVLENNKNLIPFGMYDVVKSEIEKDPSKYDTKEEINAALSNIPGVDPSKIKYEGSNLNLKSSKSEPTINSVPKKNGVTTLDEPKTQFIDRTTTSGGSGGGVGNPTNQRGSGKASTGLPSISSSNSDNNHVVYSQTQYNIIGV